MPEIGIKEGRLRLETRGEDFSKGGLASRFMLEGGFDVQVDCRMDFQESLTGTDQVLFFVLKEEIKKVGVLF